MKVKQAFVPLNKPSEVFTIIEDTLSTRPNTQIFVDNKIYERIRGRFYSPNIVDGYHYYHDLDDGSYYTIVHWYRKEDRKNHQTYNISFVSNTDEYMQVVNFSSPKVQKYTHYNAGFKQLLLILVKTEEEEKKEENTEN